jgi:CubicO group peptidase (beta-lactamase class C family)
VPETAFDEISDYLSQLETLGFAGVVAVSLEGKPVLVEGYGLADREQDTPWTPATVSTVGSLTKQFTGATLLLLQEQGLLSVDDPIDKFFDAVPEDKRSITLHHLLTHSSGIVDLDGVGDFDSIGREEFVRRAMEQPLESPSGEQYHYSNAGYSLLGAVVELVTELSFEQFLRETALVPNGIYETGYILPAWGEGRLAQGYEGGKRWGTVLERPFAEDGPYWVLRANGGLHSTVYDMLRWTHALMMGQVLSPESMSAYWAPHVSEGGDNHYGYGWSIVETDKGTLVTHDGSNGIHFAETALIPSKELVICLQTNVRSELPMAGQIVDQITARLLGDAPLPTLPQISKTPGTEMKEWVGVYELERGGSLQVSPTSLETTNRYGRHTAAAPLSSDSRNGGTGGCMSSRRSTVPIAATRSWAQR